MFRDLFRQRPCGVLRILLREWRVVPFPGFASCVLLANSLAHPDPPLSLPIRSFYGLWVAERNASYLASRYLVLLFQESSLILCLQKSFCVFDPLLAEFDETNIHLGLVQGLTTIHVTGVWV